MALLALDDYRSDRTHTNQAFAITFGAPRLGNEQFLGAFAEANPDRFLNIVDRADPVPRMPPASVSALLSNGTARPRLVNMLAATALALFYVPWRLWAKVFRVSYKGDWPIAHRREVGEPGLWFGAHAMIGYCASLLVRRVDMDTSSGDRPRSRSTD